MSEDPKDELFQLSIGNMVAMTDQGGEYVLEGVEDSNIPRSALGLLITTSKCIGKEADFWLIKPETYVACSTPKQQGAETCMSITVTDTPATQQFSLSRSP